jgi:hypothetical protein
VTVKLRLLKHRYAVNADLEPAAARGDRHDLRIGPLLLELSRQPGGSGLIVSKRAVLDRDLHEVFVGD